jgi:hypothetical protein
MALQKKRRNVVEEIISRAIGRSQLDRKQVTNASFSIQFSSATALHDWMVIKYLIHDTEIIMT